MRASLQKSTEDYFCWQMFARELAAGWTSWGNEVLRFQTSDCFDACHHKQAD
jgi:N6-adenosine-specific RNA methylase IME4